MAEKKKIEQDESLDKFPTIKFGLLAAVRSSDRFEFFKALFLEMDKFAWALEGLKGAPDPGHFLRRRYEDFIGDFWSKLDTLFTAGHLPLQGEPNEVATKFISSLDACFGSDGISTQVLKFAESLTESDAETAQRDFEKIRETLNIDCRKLASGYTPEEEKLDKSNPQAALDKLDARREAIIRCFSARAINVLSGRSSRVRQLLMDRTKSKRFPTLSGDGLNSFDTTRRGGGLSGKGVTLVLGATNQGKTLFATSLISNHLDPYVRHLLSGGDAKEPRLPRIFVYSCEDSEEDYYRRVSGNLINRHAADKGVNVETFPYQDFADACANDPRLVDIYDLVIDPCFAGLDVYTVPDDEDEAERFTLTRLLKDWDKRIKIEGPPDFIVIDHINNLNSAKQYKSRTEELAALARQIDRFASKRGIPAIVMVQADMQGSKEARDMMRFLEPENLSESKIMLQNVHGAVSLLVFTEYDKNNKPIRDRMGVKILKDRGAKTRVVYLSDLSMEQGITLRNTELVTDPEMRDIRDRTLAAVAENNGVGGQQPDGGGRGFNGGRGAGFRNGGAGGGPPKRRKNGEGEGGDTAAGQDSVPLADTGDV